ncbi:MAG TPA: Rieske 2Fe-2S domain-containing protein [Acidimicrobiales bacterium]|jgi:nitrite reductase/ring-hydroxylating ferredoxin subunit|nr:Rieske 2Fe-2S domain-containing protein [Acidimicrobiales bacterium]
MQSYSYQGHPTGWFQLEWSDALKPGDVKRLRIFGMEVILFRTEGGTVRVADAFCPHLGANIGEGGQVVGENIACPFHGWEFGPDGKNCRIPNVARANPRISLREWHVAELSGLIVVWFDSLGRDPLWNWEGAPEFSDLEHFAPLSYWSGGIRSMIPPQYLENAPDVLHFPFVHGAAEPASIVRWEESGPNLFVDYELKFGGGREPSWLTPNGPVVGLIATESCMGIGVVRFSLEDLLMLQIVCVTPVDDGQSMVFSTTTAKVDGSPDGLADQRAMKMMEAQHLQISNDFRIWENQRYVERPPYAGHEELYFPRFRRWIAQFYPRQDAKGIFAADRVDEAVR